MFFNLICIFKLEFKHTLMSFRFFFFVINTHIVNLIDFSFIKIRFNIFVCFLLSTYFLVFMKDDFIHCTVNNSIILFLYVKFISWFSIVPVVLSRCTFNILRTKVSQDLAFIR